MKKIYYCILLGFFTSTAFAQVGIGTNTPKSTLDVVYSSMATTPDGILIPRVTGNDLKSKDALYTSDQNSAIVFVTAKPTTTSTKTASIDTSGFYIYDAPNAKWLKWYDYTSTLKSFVKGSATTAKIGILNLTLGTSYKLIKFNQTDFDENNEFDTASKTFTAKQDGIYSVYVQIETDGVIAASNVGVGIFKQVVGSSTAVLLSEENFNSLTVLSIDVSPPTRKTQTLVKLNKGDKIFFGASSSLLGAQLLGSGNSFFTIQQIK